jgi:predicted  nucleic acid-binding Zn-ribbon protein
MSTEWVECVACGYEYMGECGHGWKTKCPACGSREFERAINERASRDRVEQDLTNIDFSDILGDG